MTTTTQEQWLQREQSEGSTRLTVHGVNVHEGRAYIVNGEDGPIARCDYVVSAYVAGDDHEYTYATSWRWASEAQVFADMVREVGTINPEHWDARVMYGTRTWADGGYEAAEIAREREEGYGN